MFDVLSKVYQAFVKATRRLGHFNPTSTGARVQGHIAAQQANDKASASGLERLICISAQGIQSSLSIGIISLHLYNPKRERFWTVLEKFFCEIFAGI